MTTSGNQPLLSARSIDAGYGHVRVLEDVSVAAYAGRIVALVGRNGAGKSTLLRTLSGLNRPTAGEILFDGRSIAGARPHAIVAAGLLHVAEGRRLFLRQSVADNIELGRYGLRLSEEQRLDWLRLIRTDNIGPRGIMAQPPQDQPKSDRVSV